MLNKFKGHCLYCDYIQSPASAMFRLGVSDLYSSTLFELSKKKTDTKTKSVWCLSRNHLYTSPSYHCFPFLGLQYEKIKMTQPVSA